MMDGITDDQFATGEAPTLLAQACDAERLREAQSLAGAFAAMLEGRAATIEDVVNMDRLVTSAWHRVGEALHTMGASLSCEGIA